MTERFEYRSAFRVSPERLFEWHARPGAFGRLLPPWQKALVARHTRGFSEGSTVEFGLRKGPFVFRWQAEHRDVEAGRSFTDIQLRGPFKSWTHVHDFLPGEAGGSSLHDRIEYELPAGRIGRLVAGSSIRRDLERTFRYRHRVLGEDLRLHASFADRPRLRVAITGASGLVGSALADLLTTGGHEVVRLSRTAPDQDEVEWNPASGAVDSEALRGVDAVVHLAGENVGSRRWTVGQMDRIRSSRIAGTRWLVQTLGQLPEPPRVFVSASAIGFYGHRPNERLNEGSPRGAGFLPDVSRAWEKEALAASDSLGVRTALARFGIVLSPRGGALAKMLPPFRLGLGGRLGSGRQMMSWISIDDAVAAVLHLLMNESLSGPVNLVAPGPVSNSEFTRTLATMLRRPAIAPVPALATRAAFGRMADEMLLASTEVVPQRLEESGFVFRHPTLETGLRHLLGTE